MGEPDPFEPFCKPDYCDSRGKEHLVSCACLLTDYRLSKIDLGNNVLVLDETHISWFYKNDRGDYQHKKTRHYKHKPRDPRPLGSVLKYIIANMPVGYVGLLTRDSWVHRGLMKVSHSDKMHPVGLYEPLDELNSRKLTCPGATR